MKEDSFIFFNRPALAEHSLSTSRYFNEVFSYDNLGLEFREKQIKNRFSSFEKELDVVVAWENKNLAEYEKIVTVQVDDFMVASYAEGELVASGLGFNGWFKNALNEEAISKEWENRVRMVHDDNGWGSFDLFWLMDNLSGVVSLEGSLNGYREDLYTREKPELYDAVELGVNEKVSDRGGEKFAMGLGGRLLSFPDSYVWDLKGVWSELDSDYVEQESLFKIKVAKHIDVSRFEAKDGPGKTRELVGAVFGTNGQV